MNRTEHLLACLAEECNEVAQRACKAQRFGMHEVQPGQGLTNAQRIADEISDLWAVLHMLREDYPELKPTMGRLAAKRAKVEQYMDYARTQGALQD